MCIYNDCKIVIDLNKLVKARPCGVDLADSEECREFGFTIPKYGDIQPEPGREAELTRREKEEAARKKAAAEFEMVDLEGHGWIIQVPRRKDK